MKKVIILFFSSIGLLLIISIFFYIFYQDPFYYIKPGIKVEQIKLNSDGDRDGISDLEDIVQGARNEVTNGTKYKDAYYSGGYPPNGEGVCTDVIWRALKNAGYDLKKSMDEDIKNHIASYPAVVSPDPNIDFRRVKNQLVFFQRNATELTLEVIPNDAENLKQWQGGDIIVLHNPDHVAVISDKRRKDGVPYIIHNARSFAKEENLLMFWYNAHKIVGHFRYPKG